MKLFKKMAAEQARMERADPEKGVASDERERHRREQMKRKDAGAPHLPEKVAGERDREVGGKVEELREALHRGDAVHGKKRRAILDRIGSDIDKRAAADLLKELDESWESEREVIKSRLRELDPRP